MIVGAHSIIYSKDAERDRAFLRDVIGLPGIDVGEGWLIFAVPPAEVAVHPAGENDVHEFYLMVDDVAGFVETLEKRGVACAAVQDRGWGLLTQVTLPGGGTLGVYEPRHARPKAFRASARRKPSRATRGTRRAGKSRGSKTTGRSRTRR